MTIITASGSSVTEILEGKIFLGNLSAAISSEEKAKLGITHIVSVCPDYPSTGPQHLRISVEDSEYADLLIHLPVACRFIERAIEQGGRVLVHCVMGISRSTTVVAAYLMKTRGMTPPNAIRYLKQKRHQIHPNYGFIKQLDVFVQCEFDPSPSHPKYRSWKRRHQQDVTYFLNHMSDTISIIPDRLLLSSSFPEDPDQAHSLLSDIGITHLISLSPAQIPSLAVYSGVRHHQFKIKDQSSDGLLFALPDICACIRDAVDRGGLVLIYSQNETRVCTAACAFLMSAMRYSPSRAFSLLEDALPLFNPTQNFSRNLELFHACGYHPTPNHPVVKGHPASHNRSSSDSKTKDLGKAATNILSETTLDLSAFGDALRSIQVQTTTRSFVSAS
ncbi:unnamed protein product [Cyclocybe aegerita]|uniref:protein-tyrosine-phosphatase n=1 Tax=Cyclocybe aegerita TaxID=1973307 RepID=A0A8S0WV45_CYCAE|nr:unnamed protein product [Cyclocybe aegerita]